MIRQSGFRSDLRSYSEFVDLQSEFIYSTFHGLFHFFTDHMLAKDEIFGPVQVVIPFADEDEAVQVANDTDYGLTNYVQTTDGAKANRVARRMRTGMVDINGQARSSGSPFGGYKQSGNGREGGEWGLEEFLEVKAVGGWFRDA